jgi:adenylate cyclase
MGDCVMAFWNAPLDDPDHAVHACDAALGMLDALAVLNAERRREAEAGGLPFAPLEIGIGINTGECVVGNMGSEQRFDYSVLGDAVNLASRLEGQSKYYVVPTVIGEDTAVKVADRFALLELDLVAVKGKEEAVRVYTVIGSQAVHDSADFARLRDAHAEMLAAYRAQDWDSAQRWAEVCGENPLAPRAIYDLYEERIYHLTFSPPGPNWDAVHVAETK